MIVTGRTVFAVVRLPGAAALLYAFRTQLVSWIEAWFDIVGVTVLAIEVLSTTLSRALAAAVFVVAIGVVLVALRRARPMAGVAAAMGLAALLAAAAFWRDGNGMGNALLVVTLTGTNLWTRPFPAWGAVMAAAVGVAEVAFFRRFVLWARPAADASRILSNATWTGLAHALPGLLFAGGIGALLLDGPRLVPLERALRGHANTEVLLTGDVNGIDLDPAGEHLFVTGHGVPRLRKYALEPSFTLVAESAESTGGAQGFAFDRRAGEIYVHNTDARSLMWLRADTLAVTRTVPLPDVSPGDSTVVTSPGADAIVVSSEADERSGTPLVVLRRSTREVVDERNVESGIVFSHPAKPLLYLSFFRRGSSVLLYDLDRLALTREAPADERVEGMVYWPQQNELLLGSPLQSRILRFDADTLAPKGELPTLFGARTLALDEVRGLLVAGSIATGSIEVLQLPGGRRVATRYLGPWLRAIALDRERGLAFVSSNGALYRLPYVP